MEKKVHTQMQIYGQVSFRAANDKTEHSVTHRYLSHTHACMHACTHTHTHTELHLDTVYHEKAQHEHYSYYKTVTL